MTVKLFVEIFKHSLTDSDVLICNSNSEELLEDVIYDLDRMAAGLVTDRVVDKQLSRCENCFLAHFWAVMLEVRQSGLSNKLIQTVSTKVKVAEDA